MCVQFTEKHYYTYTKRNLRNDWHQRSKSFLCCRCSARVETCSVVVKQAHCTVSLLTNHVFQIWSYSCWIEMGGVLRSAWYRSLIRHHQSFLWLWENYLVPLLLLLAFLNPRVCICVVNFFCSLLQFPAGFWHAFLLAVLSPSWSVWD